MIAIDLSLVNRLIASQFPEWAHLPIRPVEHSGWDNRTFHLGDTMTVRLPSAAIYANQVAMEHRCSPVAMKVPKKQPYGIASLKPVN